MLREVNLILSNEYVKRDHCLGLHAFHHRDFNVLMFMFETGEDQQAQFLRTDCDDLQCKGGGGGGSGELQEEERKKGNEKRRRGGGGG